MFTRFKRMFTKPPQYPPHDIDLETDEATLYQKGVLCLDEGDIEQAINLFEEIKYSMSSASFNLGIIYLDGANYMLPNYQLAKENLNLALSQGHPRAEQSLIILNAFPLKPNITNAMTYMELMALATYQFIEGGQFGNLAYLIAHDVINIVDTSSNPLYTLNRFIDYEVGCIRHFANDTVNYFYQKSDLIDWDNTSWNIIEIPAISQYINDNHTAQIMSCSDKIQLSDMGVMRLAMVNYVYQYYFK